MEAENRLSVEEVLALCGGEGLQSRDRGSFSMEVDQGKDLHVAIGKKDQRKAGEIIHLGIYKGWEELDRGGLAWPGCKQGFTVILGEEFEEDEKLKLRHWKVLAEAEDAFVGNLLRKCSELAVTYEVDRFLGDTSK